MSNTAILTQAYSAGEMVLRQGSEVDRAYKIISGEALLCMESDTGKLIIIDQLGEGDYFGFMFLMNKKMKHLETVVAKSKLVLEIIEMEDVVNKMMPMSGITKTLLWKTVERLHHVGTLYANEFEKNKSNTRATTSPAQDNREKLTQSSRV